MSTQIPEGRETFSADSCLPFELSPESQQSGANRWPVIMDINILAPDSWHRKAIGLMPPDRVKEISKPNTLFISGTRLRQVGTGGGLPSFIGIHWSHRPQK